MQSSIASLAPVVTNISLIFSMPFLWASRSIASTALLIPEEGAYPF